MNRLDKIVELKDQITELYKDCVSYFSFPSEKGLYEEWMNKKEKLTQELTQLLYGGQNE